MLRMLADLDSGPPFHLTATEVAFAVPAGVVIAAILSFLALRWSTNKTLTFQAESLDKTLANQLETTRLTIEGQLNHDNDRRLWERRAGIYPELITAMQDRNIMFTNVTLVLMPDFGRLPT